MTTLLAVAHGSRTPGGSDAARAVVARAATARPGIRVRLAFVENEQPLVTTALAELAGEDVVVVPLLLHPGVHVKRDLPAAVAGTGAVLTAALAPDRRIARAARDRLAAAGVDPAAPGWTVVVAGAGSSDPEGQADVERSAALVREGTAWSTVVGYAGSGLHPTLAEAVAAATGRVAVLPLVLGDGFMAAQAARLAPDVDVVAAPLGDHPEVAATLLDRFDAGTRARERAQSRA